MFKKGVIAVLVCVLALGASVGCLAKSTPKTSEKTFTWNRRQRQIFTVSGERFVVGHEKFAKEIQKVLPRANSWGTSLSLLYLVKKKGRLGTIKSSHTIFMVRPEYLFHLEELEAEYPDLLPISTEKLKSYLETYSCPLLYFSRDRKGKIRGVIIAKEVSPSLAKLLTEEPILLDTPLQYEDGKLEKAEKREEKTLTWNYQKRLIITVTGKPRVNNYDEFAEEMRKVFGRKLNRWGAPSFLYWEKGRIETIKSCNTIFMVQPENLYDLEDFEAEYPDLLPISTEKLKSYLKSYETPLLYFSRDYTGLIRGVIIAKEVDVSLAKLLTEEPILLDTPLTYAYEDGELKKLEQTSTQGEA